MGARTLIPDPHHRPDAIAQIIHEMTLAPDVASHIHALAHALIWPATARDPLMLLSRRDGDPDGGSRYEMLVIRIRVLARHLRTVLDEDAVIEPRLMGMDTRRHVEEQWVFYEGVGERMRRAGVGERRWRFVAVYFGVGKSWGELEVLCGIVRREVEEDREERAASSRKWSEESVVGRDYVGGGQGDDYLRDLSIGEDFVAHHEGLTESESGEREIYGNEDTPRDTTPARHTPLRRTIGDGEDQRPRSAFDERRPAEGYGRSVEVGKEKGSTKTLKFKDSIRSLGSRFFGQSDSTPTRRGKEMYVSEDLTPKSSR